MQNNPPGITPLPDIPFERATPGVRFAGFLIDMIFICLPLYFDAVFVVMEGGLPEEKDYFLQHWGVGAADLFLCFLVLVTLIAYYIIMETIWGKTIGKLAMGCKVVMNDGGRLTLKAALLRMLVRLIPLSIFTAWSGKPWHDQWTGTEVIKVRN